MYSGDLYNCESYSKCLLCISAALECVERDQLGGRPSDLLWVLWREVGLSGRTQ